MVTVHDSVTGLNFRFDTHEEKEAFFDLWDKYQILEEEEEVAE